MDDPNSTEEKSNKSEIVVSDESDSEIQVIVSLIAKLLYKSLCPLVSP